MKKSMLIVAGAILFMFACQENEEVDVVGPEVETAQADEKPPFEIYPAQELFKSDISNGFFYLTDAFQVYQFADGHLVKGNEIPDEQFKKAEVRPDAKPGVYRLASGEMFHFDFEIFDGIIHWRPFRCVIRYVAVPADCPPGQIGFTRYTIRDCYFRGRLISSDTTAVLRIPCMDIFRPEIPDLYFEDEFGNKYVNPIN